MSCKKRSVFILLNIDLVSFYRISKWSHYTGFYCTSSGLMSPNECVSRVSLLLAQFHGDITISIDSLRQTLINKRQLVRLQNYLKNVQISC